jgi:hypothetical protein
VQAGLSIRSRTPAGANVKSAVTPEVIGTQRAIEVLTRFTLSRAGLAQSDGLIAPQALIASVDLLAGIPKPQRPDADPVLALEILSIVTIGPYVPITFFSFSGPGHTCARTGTVRITTTIRQAVHPGDAGVPRRPIADQHIIAVGQYFVYAGHEKEKAEPARIVCEPSVAAPRGLSIVAEVTCVYLGTKGFDAQTFLVGAAMVHVSIVPFVTLHQSGAKIIHKDLAKLIEPNRSVAVVAGAVVAAACHKGHGEQQKGQPSDHDLPPATMAVAWSCASLFHHM